MGQKLIAIHSRLGNDNEDYLANRNMQLERLLENAVSNGKVPTLLSSHGAIEAFGTNSESWVNQFNREIDLSGRGGIE